MKPSTSQSAEARPDISGADIPHSVDLQAVADILRRFYPHLDIEEINRRLMQIVQGQGSGAIATSDARLAQG